ncbi:hypothetical protein HMPREF3213_03540 [Heyndrickxia coagulans]|uniref:Uncharacterized protein n=1 Tax=Heyndrickxia coagulans TaxID=1398 RepID=A0A133KBN2_HEYCO|nr:hypothetical protein HMPREF3213_03540 [Heyndrickxia coagulans]
MITSALFFIPSRLYSKNIRRLTFILLLVPYARASILKTPANFHSSAGAAFSAAWASNCCRPLFFVSANPLMTLPYMGANCCRF